MRRRGAYLITGGLGNMGLAVAKELARAVRAKLVLVGRSSLPDRGEWDEWLAQHDEDDPISAKIRGVKAIEEVGGTVLLAYGDVADAGELQSAIAAAYAEFGRLDGVIHAAGNVTSAGFFSIDDANPRLCETQFQSKVRGLINLEEAVRGRSSTL